MDYTSSWPQMQPNPNPYTDLYLSHSNYYSASYSHSLNSNSYRQPSIDSHQALVLPLSQPQPPGVGPPYVPTAVTVTYLQQSISFEPQQSAAVTAGSYYLDQSWAASVSQFGSTPGDAGVTMPNPTILSQRRNSKKKGPKKTKIMQSAWCEVCKIDCNSKGVLDQHKLGKKHKKNLEKIKGTTTTVPGPSIVAGVATCPATVSDSALLPEPTLAPIDKPFIGPEENPEKPKASLAQKKQKKASASIEDLETKRRKVLEGGAAAGSVRACSICNVVCNSDVVFNYHLAGQKHASMIKKQACRGGVVSAM